MSSRKKDTAERVGLETSNNLIMGILAINVVFIAGFFIITGRNNSQDTKVVLSPQGRVSITTARLASAQNALDGEDKFTEEDCNKLKQIAKEFNPSADFINCSSPDRLYLSTPDTSDKQVLSISDENYTSNLTLDKELNTVLGYAFNNTPSAGL